MSIKQTRHKIPEDLLNKLYGIYSPKIVDDILKSFYYGRRVTLRVNTIKSNENDIVEEFMQNSIKYSKYSLIPNAFIIKNLKENSIYKLPMLQEGRIYMQNLSSMLPPLFLDLHQNMNILDMCASPGSKTTQIAAMVNNKAKIVANEINILRFERLKYNLEKQGAVSVTPINKDARFLDNIYEEYFDRILLDAPCSGEGTIDINNPQSYRNWSLKNIKENSKLQKKILESGIKALKKGGILIYSTCTMSPEENEEVIDYILSKNSNLKIMDICFDFKGRMDGITKYNEIDYKAEIKKSIRILPSDEMEGFFICKILKG